MDIGCLLLRLLIGQLAKKGHCIFIFHAHSVNPNKIFFWKKNSVYFPENDFPMLLLGEKKIRSQYLMYSLLLYFLIWSVRNLWMSPIQLAHVEPVAEKVECIVVDIDVGKEAVHITVDMSQHQETRTDWMSSKRARWQETDYMCSHRDDIGRDKEYSFWD